MRQISSQRSYKLYEVRARLTFIISAPILYTQFSSVSPMGFHIFLFSWISEQKLSDINICALNLRYFSFYLKNLVYFRNAVAKPLIFTSKNTNKTHDQITNPIRGFVWWYHLYAYQIGFNLEGTGTLISIRLITVNLNDDCRRFIWLQVQTDWNGL